MVTQKNLHGPRHPNVLVMNLYMMRALQSLKSRGNDGECRNETGVRGNTNTPDGPVVTKTRLKNVGKFPNYVRNKVRMSGKTTK